MVGRLVFLCWSFRQSNFFYKVEVFQVQHVLVWKIKGTPGSPCRKDEFYCESRHFHKNQIHGNGNEAKTRECADENGWNGYRFRVVEELDTVCVMDLCIINMHQHPVKSSLGSGVISSVTVLGELVAVRSRRGSVTRLGEGRRHRLGPIAPRVRRVGMALP